MLVVVGIICGVVSLWLASALLLQQRALGTDQELSTGSAFQQALPRVLPVFGASILFGLAVLMGLLLLLVPGLILMVSLLLYMVIQLFEHKGAFDSLERSPAGMGQLVAYQRRADDDVDLAVRHSVRAGLRLRTAGPVAGVTASDAVMIGMVMQAVAEFCALCVPRAVRERRSHCALLGPEAAQGRQRSGRARECIERCLIRAFHVPAPDVAGRARGLRPKRRPGATGARSMR